MRGHVESWTARYRFLLSKIYEEFTREIVRGLSFGDWIENGWIRKYDFSERN